MAQEKITFGFRIRHLFTYRPWLKLVALAISIALWYFISSGKLK